MKNNETKKTMMFWIFSGIGAIVASQLPFILKKKHGDNHTRQKKKLRG